MMKRIIVGWFLLAAVSAYGQKEDDSGQVSARIRSICQYLAKNVLQPRGIKDKPNLWPLYIDIDYSRGPFLYDSIQKTIPHLPKYLHREFHPSKIHYTDSSVAHIFDDYQKVGPGMTIFLAPPNGRFFVGTLREAHAVHSGGYVWVFEFEGDKIKKSYVQEWFN